jgi:hypothetical protein
MHSETRNFYFIPQSTKNYFSFNIYMILLRSTNLNVWKWHKFCIGARGLQFILLGINVSTIDDGDKEEKCQPYHRLFVRAVIKYLFPPMHRTGIFAIITNSSSNTAHGHGSVKRWSSSERPW